MDTGSDVLREYWVQTPSWLLPYLNGIGEVGLHEIEVGYISKPVLNQYLSTYLEV